MVKYLSVSFMFNYREGNLQKYAQRYKNDPLQYTGAADTGCWKLRDPKQLWSKQITCLPELLLNSSTDLCLIFSVRNTNERKSNMHYPLGRECDKMWTSLSGKHNSNEQIISHSLILWSEFWVFQAHFPAAPLCCWHVPREPHFSVLLKENLPHRKEDLLEEIGIGQGSPFVLPKRMGQNYWWIFYIASIKLNLTSELFKTGEDVNWNWRRCALLLIIVMDGQAQRCSDSPF